MHPAHRASAHKGFTLVEMSIVLVIIGLLIGGVLAGKNLIRAGQIRGAIGELQRYRSAVNAFREKYQALPGDMANATEYWGDNSTYCADATVTDGSPGTCNGNANGVIVVASAANTTGEIFQFWNQLSLAGFIEGTYTGISGAGGQADVTIGTNTPGSRLRGAGWFVVDCFNCTGTWPITYTADYGNFFILGGPVAGSWPNAAIMTPREAWTIDLKIDDGQPGRGMTIARYLNNTCSKASSITDYDADYDISDPTNQCALYFVKTF